MAERFNTRNVQNKEIYDSYMGILRISPNEIKGTDVDDPTQLLNTLFDEDKNRRTKIILSDSDGNVLPVHFQPRAFETTAVRIDNSPYQVDLLHVATIVGKDNGNDASFTNSTLYVSNELRNRSTLLVIRDEEETAEEYRKSNFRILSGGEASVSSNKKTGRGWLLYPTESPNDENYFNNKNKLNLFDSNDKTPRDEQVYKALYQMTRAEHDRRIPKNERVFVNNKLVTQLNEHNEEVPVYYTREQVLGHYDGHNTKNQNVTNHWGVGDNEGITDYTTKLSWIRFDKLVWDSLNEVLSGKTRHVKGRYDSLGINEIADPGIRDFLGFTKGEHTYEEFAPILGTEMARGMITYHAMPFHRYWFYRTRQALRSCIERRKLDLVSSDETALGKKPEGQTLDDYVISKGLDKITTSTGEKTYALINDKASLHTDEVSKLQNFYKNNLITPCSSATVGFVHSLGKDFVICNGRELTFKNFPNLSIYNEEVFQTDSSSSLIDQATKELVLRTSWDNSAIGAIKASTNSAGSYVKLPNLFALFESSPRFIRGLNWQATSNDNAITLVYDKNATTTKSDYAPQDDDNPGLTVKKEIITANDNTYTIANKNFRDVSKLHFHTYDHLIDKEWHRHKMFSSIEGGTQGTNYKGLNNIHCGNTRGGNIALTTRSHCANMMNFDRTYSKCDLFVNSGTYYFDTNTTEWDDKGAWASYCMGKVYTSSGFYENYTPLPNIGLYMFNTSICNNKEQASGSRGSVYQATYFVDAEGTTHNLAEEAPITASQDASNASINQYDKEKWRRKFYAMKLNEAEGYIPISWYGKASGSMYLAYSRDERRGTKSSSRNTYGYSKYNIGGYKMASPVAKSQYNEDESFWRCLTSIQYLNPDKLGVGDIKNYIQNKEKNDASVNYYDVNCVTQLPSQDTFVNYKYGGKEVEVDTSCPQPAHMKFLPLIRI